MELLYTILWKACTWFLLSFLVARLVSLIACISDDVLVSGLFKEERFKLSETLDSNLNDEDDDQKKEVETEVYGDRLKVFENKRIKFVDQSVKLVEFQSLEDVFVRDIEEILSEVIVYNKGFEMGNIEKGGEFGEELVDQIEVVQKNVGFENKVGGKLESGNNLVDKSGQIVDHIKEEYVGFEDRECHDIVGGVLAGRKVVDDESNGENSSKGEISGREFDRDEGVLSDDEEWEGIERSELEKKFARAINFVECKNKEGRFSKADNDVMMQLYGFQKVAMEGQCHEPQPMALKLSARAKWNAWQRLGNMTQEDAMNQYISLLSDNIPEWMEGHSLIECKPRSSSAAVISSPEANPSTPLAQQDKE
ncbi:acyl-CoA-binding domain-containing protein 3 [Beta vulgaris subsp. vulgaris]|uniref:acyl-CoA-binding domain-containing protein 3 n=1 Tax=Beta vulgaris subsp. vulgaris TaxID=3555 RepID=UPI00203670A4|nr:acyl-CoA-binding domain-containing protein 3 [Beta vulgaris subsp. vulgaris]